MTLVFFLKFLFKCLSPCYPGVSTSVIFYLVAEARGAVAAAPILYATKPKERSEMKGPSRHLDPIPGQGMGDDGWRRK